jgi:hypothetical protein
MKLVLNSETGFEPVAVRYLGEIPDRFLFHRQHALRHPLATYKISLEQLANEFRRVLNHHDAMQRYWKAHGPSTTEPQPYTELLAAQRSLIYSLREHIDDCHLVLQSLVDPATVNVSQPGADAFLRAARFPTLTTFFQPLKPFLDGYLLPMVNKLKHKQGRLRGCMFFNYSEIRLGYFLEEVDDMEVAGPSETLHPGNTAFSFARDVRLNLFHVYFASARLVKAIAGALRSLHRYRLAQPAPLTYCNLLWRQIARRASELPLAVFPQELQLGFPDVKLTDEGLVLEYPAQDPRLDFPGAMRVVTSTQGDGVTKSFRFPYLRRNSLPA